MKQFKLIFLCFWILLSAAGCVQHDKSKIIEKYKYVEEINRQSLKKQVKLEPWVKEGIDCFGVIMVCDVMGDPVRIKEVNVRIVNIRPDSLRMEAREDVIINRVLSCKKVTLKKGQQWNEEYGEIFKTRLEAINYIDSAYPGLRVNH